MKAWTIYLRYRTCNDVLLAQLVLQITVMDVGLKLVMRGQELMMPVVYTCR